MLRISSVSFAALAVGLLIATVIDMRTRRIPNLVTGSMVIAGVGLAAAGFSSVSVGAAAAGTMLGLALMLPGHLLGATGAGDVKLMAAVGSLLGPWLVVDAFLFTAVTGGLLALVIALARRRLAVMVAGTARLIAAPSGARAELKAAPKASRFAYGPAIAIGSLLAVLVG